MDNGDVYYKGDSMWIAKLANIDNDAFGYISDYELVATDAKDICLLSCETPSFRMTIDTPK